MVCTFCTPHHTYPVHSLNNDLDRPLHIIKSKQWTPRQRQYPGSTTCYTFQANIVDNLEMLYSYSHSLTENLFLSRFVFQITFFQAYLIRLWDYLYFLLLSQYLPFLATSRMFFILLNYIQHFPPIIFFHFHILHIQLEDILTLNFSKIHFFFYQNSPFLTQSEHPIPVREFRPVLAVSLVPVYFKFSLHPGYRKRVFPQIVP